MSNNAWGVCDRLCHSQSILTHTYSMQQVLIISSPFIRLFLFFLLRFDSLFGRGRVKRKILIPTKIFSPLVYVDMYGVSVLKKRKNSAGHRHRPCPERPGTGRTSTPLLPDTMFPKPFYHLCEQSI